MDLKTKKRPNKYDRVMSRVYNQSKPILKSSSVVVTRHDPPSSVRLSANSKPSVTASSVYSELPTVLNDYIPDSDLEKPKRRLVIKPRKTLKSLDPALSPPRPRPVPRFSSRSQYASKQSPHIRAEASAPSVLTRDPGKWSESHVRQCYSSRSHSKVKELKDEIQMYHENEKLMKIRSRLYKSCGVVLDDFGFPAVDKAIQVECADEQKPEEKENKERSNQQRVERADAGTSVPDEQMRAGPLRYPVDRYLVESSKKLEIVNITDSDDLWNPEPALRPEDELILRKLHEMLQTTAGDLKLLSGELAKFHEPGVQVKAAPTPLDEDFNQKVHIEEIVNAKFHGYKIIENQHGPPTKPRNDANEIKANISQRPKVMNTGAQEKATTVKLPINRNLGITRTRIIQIDECKDNSSKEKLNNGKVYKAPKATVAYNEFCYEHVEPEVKDVASRKLQFQHMPRIDIRSELREQKVLQLDIVPDSDVVKKINTAKSNVSVIALQHENCMQKVPAQPNPVENLTAISNKTCRRVSKMSTCDSSGSANNISSDAQVKLSTQKRIISSIRNSPLTSARNRYKKMSVNKSEHEKRAVTNLDEWKKKLNIVYGTSSKKTKTSPHKVSERKSSPKKNNASKTLNNAKYIPYSQLTLGGVRVSDVEKEISHIPNKNSIPLSPILDKMLSSRENSFRKENTKKREKFSPRILTTSDENLLQEVMEIERNVSKTLSKKIMKSAKDAKTPVTKAPSISNPSSEDRANDKDSESYADDFEEDKSDDSTKSGKPKPANRSSDNDNLAKSDASNSDDGLSYDENAEHDPIPGPSKPDTTYTKLNLSFRDSVEVFEFIHSVDVQDTATQSNTTNKITPKETQTSPRNERSIVQPTIHNDLWSLDSRREVEKMFEMEKDFIKKLIIDEYGNLLEKNINKPSTSNDNVEDCRKNVSAIQKNTQTSPARVKNVMTSPKRTKTRMTSPFHLSVPVHQQTSPIVSSPEVVVTEEQQNIDVTNEDDDISVILSSPRFSLRLPQNFREVISNIEAHSRNSSKNTGKTLLNKIFRVTASSSSLDADNSSSELSSLGEVRRMKKFRRRVPSISECSSSSKYSSDFQSMGILPLRSEGELSLGQIAKVRAKKIRNSEGETSLDPLL